MISRREFLGAAFAGSAATLIPSWAQAATIGRVVVIGGGMAGATVAKYLRKWSNGAVDVTMIEQESRYTSNIMSNLVITGQMPMSSLYYNYTSLVKSYGIKLVTGTVTAITPNGSGWIVTTQSGSTTVSTPCERVVVAPGVQFDSVPLTSDVTKAAPVVHAWQAGPQTTLLNKQLLAMKKGGTFVMTIPKSPYRCPPGPYERACVVADYLKRKNPGSKVIVLDANPSIQAEAENFYAAFNGLYSGIVDYRTSVIVSSAQTTVGAASGTIETNQGVIRGDVINIIPPHRAGKIAFDSGLVPTGFTFAPVDVRSFESTVPAKTGIHVLGDASTGTGLPKAGHVGNQGAKICASAIIRAFYGQAPDQAPTANSACFSPIDSKNASWLTAVYQYKDQAPSGFARGTMIATDVVTGATGAAAVIEANGWSTKNFSKMNTWYKTLMSDTFA